MRNVILLMFLSLATPLGLLAQKNTNYILFYTGHADSFETNLYSDTLIKFDINIQYQHLKSANVSEDIKRALGHGDKRFICISGYSTLFPGLEDGLKGKYKELLQKNRYKVIAGTSDVIEADDPPLQPEAYKYAKTYNLALLNFLNKL